MFSTVGKPDIFTPRSQNCNGPVTYMYLSHFFPSQDSRVYWSYPSINTACSTLLGHVTFYFKNLDEEILDVTRQAMSRLYMHN